MNRLKVILRGFLLMSPSEFRRAAGILVLMMGAGFLESAIVALVIPIVYVAVDPTKLSSTKLGTTLSGLFGAGDPQQFFVYLAGILVGLLIVSSAISMLTRYLSELHGMYCMKRLGGEVLRRCVAAPYIWVLGRDTTELSNYVVQDVVAWRRDFLRPLFVIVQSAIMIIAPIAVTLTLAPVTGLVALTTAAVIVAAIVLALRRRIYREAQLQREAQYSFVRLVREVAAALREIKVGDHGDYFIGAFGHYQEALGRSSARLRVWSEAPTAAIMLLGQIGFLATGVVLFLNNASRAEIAGQLALIGFVVTRVLPAFNRLANQVPTMTRAAPYVQAIFRLFDQLDRLTPPEQGADAARPVVPDWRAVQFDNVSFSYSSAKKPSLQGANLELKRGGFYGFVGQSGAGKTTLANLLLGLLDPTTGAVSVDGTPLRELSRRGWQRRFGYVPQDPYVLDDTVRENITFGVAADDEKVWEALRRARLADVIEKLDGGLDARVGERGRQLSGGQVQRLAIARALFGSPDILFLDEATSALDGITEAELLGALNDLRGGTMIIMITHRLHSLRTCDGIFVLENGAIIANGTYDELEQKSKPFRDLTAISAAALEDV